MTYETEQHKFPSASFLYFLYYIFRNLNWVLEFYSGTGLLLSVTTATVTIVYLSYKLLHRDAGNKPLLNVIFAVFWIYQCILLFVGEYFMNGMFGALSSAVPEILVGTAILFMVLDEKFYASLTQYASLLKILCVMLLTVPIFLIMHFGVALSLRATGELLGKLVVYQGYGDFCVIMFCITIVYFKRYICKIALSAFACYSLMVLGSKATLSGLVLSIFVVSVLQLIKTKRYKIVLCLICLLPVLCSCLYNAKDAIYQSVPDEYEWVANLFYQNVHEGSYQTRINIEKINAETRPQRMLLGDYKFESTSGVGRGKYTHNVLYYLDAYGLIYFLILCGLYLYIYAKNILLYMVSDNKLCTVAILLLTYLGILSIFARTLGMRAMMIPLGIGMYVLSHNITENNKDAG